MSQPTTAPPAAASIAWRDVLSCCAEWCRRRPLDAFLFASAVAVIVYYFGFYPAFLNGQESTAVWAYRSWNSENDLEHGWLILPAALFIVWYHRDQLRAAPKSVSWGGLGFVLLAVALYVASVRTLQGRVALAAFPLLCYGFTRFLWGKKTARIIIFPCAFLLFMIPVGFLVSRTVGLQTLAATFASGLSNLLGIGVVSDGATLSALNGSFQFEVAGGCSGIRSLTAMTMLAALYVHFTQRQLWKKILIFACSLVFAVIGNLVRIFTVVIFARFINPEIAAGLYHDYSGFIFFPIAVGAMVGFSNLLNRDWGGLVRLAPGKTGSAEETPGKLAAERRQDTGPISYDY